jgi:hypothetical protein
MTEYYRILETVAVWAVQECKETLNIALCVTEWSPPFRERGHVPGQIDPIASAALRRIR